MAFSSSQPPYLSPVSSGAAGRGGAGPRMHWVPREVTLGWQQVKRADVPKMAQNGQRSEAILTQPQAGLPCFPGLVGW